MLDNAKINDFISDAFEDTLHAKRIASLANAVQGAIHPTFRTIFRNKIAYHYNTYRHHSLKPTSDLTRAEKWAL
ncbi:hypothetical protein DJ252_23100 [Salmonella enterica subsp. enterica serovar Uzaramo]|nr:hypothetical protein [Salmonella enterica subsp. enterica serovar Uzaramo]